MFDNQSALSKISWIIYTTLIVLLAGVYFNKDFVFANFHWFRFCLYIGAPLAINFVVLKISLSELGLGAWSWNKKTTNYFWAVILIAPFIFLALPLFNTYFQQYPQYQNPNIDLTTKALRFGVFTFSTLPGWEFLHRGFMLFGIRHLLLKIKIQESIASGLSVLVVVMSETLYHLIKPDLEAFGMLIFSPILCWFALRTRSIWAPLILHLYIEALFFLQISRNF